jgi:SsrA-binding protein
MTVEKAEQPLLASNRAAYHHYEVLDRLEAGVELVGCEVKSLRAREANLKDSFAILKNGELWLLNMYVAPYPQGNRANPDPVRTRRLLVHRHEINRLAGKVTQRGYTLVPLAVYLKGRRVKIELGLCRGKHAYDKKDVIKERDLKREADREAKERK